MKDIILELSKRWYIKQGVMEDTIDVVVFDRSDVEEITQKHNLKVITIAGKDIPPYYVLLKKNLTSICH